MTKRKATPATAPTVESLLADAQAALDALPQQREQLVAQFNVKIGELRGREETLKAQIARLDEFIASQD